MTTHQLHQPPIPYLDRLRDELVAAHPVTRARVRRRRVMVGTFAALLVIATFGTFTIFRSTPASAAVIVTHDGDAIVVRITNGRAPASEVSSALRTAGIDAQVSEVATGPSGVDRVVGITTTTGVSHLGGRRGSGFTVARFSASGAPQTTVKIGRAANSGEPYGFLTDAFLPGEPLACLPLSGKPATEVMRAVAAHGLSVTWLDTEGRFVSTPTPGTFVGIASAMSTHDVLLRLTRTPMSSPLPSGCS
jgi:hypothetical protein